GDEEPRDGKLESAVHGHLLASGRQGAAAQVSPARSIWFPGWKPDRAFLRHREADSRTARDRATAPHDPDAPQPRVLRRASDALDLVLRLPFFDSLPLHVARISTAQR